MARINIRKYASVIAVIALLVFSHYFKILDPIEAFLSNKLSPILNIFYALSSGISGGYSQQTDKVNFAEELKKARETINQLTAERAELKFLEEENLVLRKQLNFLAKSDYRYVMANIISRSQPESDSINSRAIIIDKGKNDGLYAGLAVTSVQGMAASSRGVIIGKVINAKDNLSEIYLITDKKCKLASAILGENKTIGIAAGELGLTIKMNFIPQTEKIKINDLMATSGLEQGIPRGLLIGRVVKVDKENNEVWQSATIEPQINLDSLSVVAVLIP